MTRRPIRQLSASVVNKIAAGEVIERPASVVKELLENSVDAGATRIELALENGGTELIRITDNGCGIPNEQLTLAVTPHATSKIADADELFQVGTFGFRGEALASITEISHSVIRSRTIEQNCGYELVIRGGEQETAEPCGAPIGTTIEIRKLFYNTPVRGKFLKTPQTEKGHIIEAFTRIALAHPEIQLSLLHNDRPMFELAATENWQERIDAFFGAEISDALIPVASDQGGISIQGYVVDPSVSRSNNRMQYLFLNHRYIRDRSLQHALGEAYRGLLMKGRFPVCFLRMDMPFELVDVNVHPAKLEVRFQNAGAIYSQLLSVIRNRFLTTDLTAYAQLSNTSRRPVPEFQPFSDGGLSGNSVAHLTRDDRQNPPPLDSPYALRSAGPVESQSKLPFPVGARPPIFSQSQLASRGNGDVNSEKQMQDSGQDTRPVFARPDSLAPWEIEMTTQTGHHSGPVENFAHGDLVAHRETQTGPEHHPQLADDSQHTFAHSGDQRDQRFTNEPTPTEGVKGGWQRNVQALQVHNTYLIQETEEGMVVIDQHALHERVLYEQLRKKFRNGQLESQRLLVPEPITLPANETAAILDGAELLAKIGIEVEPFGRDTVIITAYPAMLAKQNPAEILGGLIDKLTSENKRLDNEDLIDELLHMMSCKAAIKAGDKLTPQEIDALLAHRELCHDAHHCPHGRPTALVFSREELDRRFKRI